MTNEKVLGTRTSSVLKRVIMPLFQVTIREHEWPAYWTLEVWVNDTVVLLHSQRFRDPLTEVALAAIFDPIKRRVEQAEKELRDDWQGLPTKYEPS